MNEYYTPGVCNINESEVKYRMKAFYLGAGIGIPLLLLLVIINASPTLGLLMFVPGWIASIGYLQAKYKFCVGYASSGVYNSGDEYAETQKIVDESKRRLDKNRAAKINAQSVFIGVVVAVLSSALLTVIQ